MTSLSPALLAAMATFSLSMSISPGPANMICVASGARHGFWRTQPFVTGATVGFTALLVLVGFGLSQIIQDHPRGFRILGLAGAAFIIHMGIRIARSSTELAPGQGTQPGFLQGALLMWLNPKAWIAAAAGSALFSSPTSSWPLIVFCTIYFCICQLSLALWALLGERVGVLLDSPGRIRVFNRLMGGLLIVTALYMIWQQFSD